MQIPEHNFLLNSKFLISLADEAVSQLKKGGPGMGSKTVPVKHRDMARRSSDIGPMKRIPTKATMGRPDVTRSMSNTNTPTGHRSLARVSRQQVQFSRLLFLFLIFLHFYRFSFFEKITQAL